MSTDRVTENTGWSARPALAAAVRATTFLVPVALAAAAILGAATVVPRPVSLPAQLGRLAAFLAVSWAVAWCAHRVLQRVLPLAALLEMSLCFPQTAPSRLRLAQRSGSAPQLATLLTAPANESTQQAAERMLTLITALGTHDRKTRGHAERVRAYAELIAASMGLPDRDRDRLRWAALMHDIGKLHVPAALLNKAGKPDTDEWAVLRDHPRAGAEIAGPLLEWLKPMDLVIVEHHERWDGTGYPTGTGGQDLSEGSRIVQVADAFEVMTSARSYKRPVRKDAALRELVRCAGSQFDPRVVRAMVAIPGRKLLWAAGPVAWLAELPLLGVNTTTFISSTASQIGGVAASAAIAGAVTLSAGAPAAAIAAAPPASGAGSAGASTGAATLTGSAGGVPYVAGQVARAASLRSPGGSAGGSRLGQQPAPGAGAPAGSGPGTSVPGGSPPAAGGGSPVSGGGSGGSPVSGGGSGGSPAGGSGSGGSPAGGSGSGGSPTRGVIAPPPAAPSGPTLPPAPAGVPLPPPPIQVPVPPLSGLPLPPLPPVPVSVPPLPSLPPVPPLPPLPPLPPVPPVPSLPPVPVPPILGGLLPPILGGLLPPILGGLPPLLGGLLGHQAPADPGQPG
ncbi:MAG TPA: HD domain-containing phosphohydrolase [Mycobacteriales bacterium]|nr:HD domain-containing phosphohydrolase [Mycobacteriales bacterium]